MLKWENKQWIESDQGFSFLFTGRYSAEYIEGEQKLTLSIEDGIDNGKYGIIVKSEAIKKWDSNRKISKIEKDIILKNIAEALEFQNLVLIIED